MFKLPFFKQRAPGEGSKKIFMALGNPGEKHASTYHNAGIIYIESLTKEPFRRYKNFAFVRTEETILAKSLLFMNQSGIAVREALKYFGLSPENLIVVHDDTDIPLGQHKISFASGSAGHKGVESVINHLHTKEFYRIRLGVGGKNQKAGNFVLKPMSKKDRELLEKSFSEIETDHLDV